MFTLVVEDTFIWNQVELIGFLVQNQKKDIILTLQGEGPSAKAIGLYDLLDQFNFSSVTILTANAIEHHPKYKIKITTNIWSTVNKSINSEFHIWNQNKLFGAFYGRPRWHRIGLASYMKIHHDDISLINIRGKHKDEDDRRAFGIDTLFNYAPTQLSNFTKIYHQFPMIIEQFDRYRPGKDNGTDEFTSPLVEFYKDIFIDVVAETYTNGECFFPTEKTFRPILMKKPFIIMGTKNHLHYLRQMGFKTFNQFWSEDYDPQWPPDKFTKILQLLDKLAIMNKNDLYNMYQSMQEILDYNYQLLLSRRFNLQLAPLYEQ